MFTSIKVRCERTSEGKDYHINGFVVNEPLEKKVFCAGVASLRKFSVFCAVVASLRKFSVFFFPERQEITAKKFKRDFRISFTPSSEYGIVVLGFLVFYVRILILLVAFVWYNSNILFVYSACLCYVFLKLDYPNSHSMFLENINKKSKYIIEGSNYLQEQINKIN